MNLMDKVYNKLGYILLDSKLSSLVIMGIILVSKNHIYIDRYFIKFGRILKLLKEFEGVSITGTGVLIIFYKNSIVKYPLGNHSYKALHNEYNNYLLLKESRLLDLVDYFLEKKYGYFVMEKLLDVTYPVQEHKKIYLQLSKIKSKNIGLSGLLKNQVFSNALGYIETECSDFYIEDILSLLKSKKTIKSYPMHGDLTQYNIMKNKEGNIVLIDLDRFSFNGIENIDRIHFAIEYYAKKRKKDFFSITELMIKDKNISMQYFYLLFLYFIYRIGVEYNKDVELPLSYRNNMCKVIEIFLISYQERK